MRLVLDLSTKNADLLLEVLSSLNFVDSVAILRKTEDEEGWSSAAEESLKSVWDTPENEHWGDFLEQSPDA
jgi:hypothetical protein